MEQNFFASDSASVAGVENVHKYVETSLKASLKTSLKGIREEFDDHLESINDNTNEIQANYEYISRIDEKLEKVMQRLEHIESWLSRITGVPLFHEEEEQRSISLDDREKKIFLLLYTASENDQVTYQQIAEYISENDFLVRGYITNMLEKGVPIQKRYSGKDVHLSLNREFKEKQAKRNIVGINQKTVKEFLR